MAHRSKSSPGKRDHYEVLGVSREATPEDIKKAYRRLAMQWHPDRNPDQKQLSEEKFKEASEAYSVLSDPQKKAHYDQFGHAGVGEVGGFGGFDPTIFSEFNDILGDFFGGGDMFGAGTNRRRTRAQRGADLRYDLKLTFEEAAFGTKTRIKIPRTEACPTCGGSGVKPGTHPSTCRSCGGRGALRYQQGFLTISRTCPACSGTGKEITDPCKNCRGDGRVRVEKTLSVSIPAGVDAESRLRITGEGEAGVQGGPPGDLYVFLHVAPHSFFERQGHDLICTLPISFSQAALGAHLDASDDREAAFAAFQAERLPNARAIQAMALENYLEMRDRVDDDDYLLQRALEMRLASRHPDRFVPRYAMVTFRRMPYALAFERGQLQRDLLVELTRGHDSLDTLDWDAVDATVRERLSPLPADA